MHAAEGKFARGKAAKKIASRSSSRGFCGRSTRNVYAKPSRLVKPDWPWASVYCNINLEKEGVARKITVLNKVDGYERTLLCNQFEICMFQPKAGDNAVIHVKHADGFEKFIEAYEDEEGFSTDWVMADKSPLYECIICKPDTAEGPSQGTSIASRAVKQANTRERAAATFGETTGRKRHNGVGANEDAAAGYECYMTLNPEPIEHCKMKGHYLGVASLLKSIYPEKGWKVVGHSRKIPGKHPLHIPLFVFMSDCTSTDTRTGAHYMHSSHCPCTTSNEMPFYQAPRRNRKQVAPWHRVRQVATQGGQHRLQLHRPKHRPKLHLRLPNRMVSIAHVSGCMLAIYYFNMVFGL